MRGLIRLLFRVALPRLLLLLRDLVRSRGDAQSRSGTAARRRSPATQRPNPDAEPGGRSSTLGPVERAFANQQSDVMVTQNGTVLTELRDDTIGARHQRLLVELDSGLTLLIAHNIDLARRVANPVRGEPIRFKGEYEYNAKGGVLHWTHHDPKGWHEDGWIEYDGQVYG